MEKKIQMNVVGKEPAEKVVAYNDLVKCLVCVSGRICTFWTTEENYKSLIYDGFFIRDGRLADASGVVNTTNVYVEEPQDITNTLNESDLSSKAPEMLRLLNSMMLSMKAHPDYVNGESQEFINYVEMAEELISSFRNKKGTSMKSQFIKDVETFSTQMAERLPLSNEGGIIIMATDGKDVITSIIAKPHQRKVLVERLLANEDIQNDIIEIIE